tara:strand:- start:342 stop:716 length:375 start_codon:yes stop_codon:yes gene_type:complete
MKVVGIDYGTKKVGVALSDEDRSLAFPLKVVETKDIVSFILSLEKEVDKVVIGESQDFHMEDNPVMKDARVFGEELKEKGFEVVFEPEFMSSMQASRIQGYNKKQDASAAAIILQSYLDKQKNI